MNARTLLAAAAALLACAALVTARTQAAPIADDSFLSGPTPALGQYTPGDLVPQNPTVSTFNAPWADGLTTTVPGTFDAVTTGLTWTGFGATGGAVQFQNAESLPNTQAAVRPFTNPVTLPYRVYYMAGLMSFDEDFSTATTSLALTGMLNVEEGDPIQPLVLGVQWGFQGDGAGGVNAVVRARSKDTGSPVVNDVVASSISPGTHLFVVKVENDYTIGNSGDRVSVWLDPVAGSPEFETGAATFIKDYANWINPSEDTTRTVKNLVFRATDVGANAAVGYDEVRMGERWAEVVPLTNPDVVFLRQGFDNYQHLACQIREGSTNQYGTNAEILVGNNGGPTKDFRTVLAFGTNDVPDGATITSVELTLTTLRTSVATGTGSIELRLTDPSSDMDENVVTWTKINSTADWTTGGGDPQSTALSSAAQPTAVNEVVTFQSTSALVAAVQAAVDGDELLELVMMAPSAEAKGDATSEKNFVGFHSDDATNALYRPLLKITYAPVPEPSVFALLLGAAGMLFIGCRDRLG